MGHMKPNIIAVFWHTGIVNWVKGHRDIVIDILDLYIHLEACVEGNQPMVLSIHGQPVVGGCFPVQHLAGTYGA